MGMEHDLCLADHTMMKGFYSLASCSIDEWSPPTQVKVDRPVHARSKHARYMHNDAQQCNGPAQTGPLQACKFKISKI